MATTINQRRSKINLSLLAKSLDIKYKYFPINNLKNNLSKLYLLALDEVVITYFQNRENIEIITLNDVELFFPELLSAKTNIFSGFMSLWATLFVCKQISAWYN